MAGRRFLLAVVLLCGGPARDLDRAVAPAGPGRPQIHPDRPPVPDRSLARRGSRHGPASALPRADRGGRADRCAVFAGRGPGHLANRRPGGGGPGLAGASLPVLRPHAIALRRADRLHGGRDLRPLAGPRGGRSRHAERQPRAALHAALLCAGVPSRIRTGDWRPALAAGLAGGVGYLARPEAILAPAALGLAWLFTMTAARGTSEPRSPLGLCRPWALVLRWCSSAAMPW